MEPGIRAQRVELGIFGGPILVEGAVLHDFCEAGEGVFGAAEEGVRAGPVIENGRFFRIDGKRAASPLEAFYVVSRAGENARAQVESTWIVGVSRCAARSIATRVAG